MASNRRNIASMWRSASSSSGARGLILALALGSCRAGVKRGGDALGTVDLLLLSGDVVTMDERRPRARAVAVRAGRIVALGEDGELASLAGPRTRTIDL